MAKRSAIWEVHTPGMAYSESVYFARPVSEHEARMKVCRIRCVKRLRAGTELWPWYAQIRRGS